MWDESKHPRDAIGRWTNGKGEAARKKEQEAEALYNDDHPTQSAEASLNRMAPIHNQSGKSAKEEDAEKRYNNAYRGKSRPTRTRKQNEKVAKQMAHDVELRGQPQYEYGVFLDHLLTIFKKYGLRKLDFITAEEDVDGRTEDLAGALGDRLILNMRKLGTYKRFFADTVTNHKEVAAAKTREAEAELQKAIRENMPEEVIQSLQVIAETYKKYEEYPRGHVLYKDKILEGLAAHEAGHIIADQLFGQTYRDLMQKGIDKAAAARKRQLVEKVYNESMNNGDILNLSAYASWNEHEFFAEAFVMYHMKKERMPQNIYNMMKVVLKKWKKK